MIEKLIQCTGAKDHCKKQRYDFIHNALQEMHIKLKNNNDILKKDKKTRCFQIIGTVVNSKVC